MKCSICGHECNTEAKCCPECGANLEIRPKLLIPKLVVPEIEVTQEYTPTGIMPSPMKSEANSNLKKQEKQEEQEEQSSKGKIIKYSVIGAGVLILIFVLISRVTKLQSHESNYVYFSENQLMVWYGVCEDRKTEYCITNQVGNQIANISEQPMHMNSSLDRSVVAFSDEKGNLSVVTDDGMKEIANNVSEFIVSEDGSKIAYIIPDENSSSFGNLYVYDIDKQKASIVANNCHVNTLAISPDGGSIAFIKDYKGRSDYKLCISMNGNEYETVEKNKTPVAISNNGAYLYYLDGNALYVKSNENTYLLTADFNGKLIFNCDYTQIIIEEDDHTFISRAGTERQKVSDHTFQYLLLPEGVATNTTILNKIVRFGRGYKDVYGVYELTNQAYLLDGVVYYVTDQLVKYQLCPTEVTDFKISKNGKKIAYTYFGCLYYVSILENTGPKREKVTNDIGMKFFSATDDLKDIYYINSYRTLYHVDKYGERTKLAEEVDGFRPYMDYTEDIVYFFQEVEGDYGSLYYCKGTGKKKKVKGADHVKLDGYTNGLCYLEKNDDGTYNKYILHDGESILLFKNLIKDY